MTFNSKTHGGRAIRFEWESDDAGIHIQNEKGKFHHYPLGEVKQVLEYLQKNFGSEWFPLANNVEKVYRQTEKKGLGTGLYGIKPNTLFAQGASYLGVVLEQQGFLEWNGMTKGIMWRIVK